jgi:hypothetical protein
MERFSFTGIYPVTEDLQPGDILLDLVPDPGVDTQPALRRLGSVDRSLLLQALADQERGRLRVEGRDPPPRPPAAAAAADPAQPSGTVTTIANVSGADVVTQTTIRPAPADRRAPPRRERPASGGNTSRPNVPHVGRVEAGFGVNDVEPPRLRRVALPAITVARVTQTQLAGGGPLASFGAILGGLGFDSVTAVWIRLKELSTLGLDDLPARRLLQRVRPTWIAENLTAEEMYNIVAGASPALAIRICAGERAPDERSTIRVVNRVLYTNSIEYEFERQTQFAGRLAAEVAQPGGAPLLLPNQPGAAPPAPEAAPAATLADATAALNEVRRELAATQQALAAALPTRPGGSLTVGVGTFGNLALQENSNRPLAAGYAPLISYPVRDAMVIVDRNQQTADRRLEVLVAACRGTLSEARHPAASRYTSPLPPGVRLTWVEELVCENSNDFWNYDLQNASATRGQYVVPTRCVLPPLDRSTAPEQAMQRPASGPGSYRPAPFRPAPPQSPTRGARSLI